MAGEREEVPLGRRVVRGGAVIIGAQALSRIGSTACTLVLAGVLVPEDFGLVATAMLAMTLLDTISTLGLGSALQSLPPTSSRDRTAMSIALLVGMGLFVIAFLTAGVTAELLGSADATPLLRALTPLLLVGRISEILRSRLDRQMRFQRTVAIDIVSMTVGIAVGISLALAGSGPWALVGQAVAGEVLSCVALATLGAGVPRPGWSSSDARELWGFSRNLLGNAVFVYAYTNLDDIYVSRVAGATALGLYGFAYRVSNTPTYILTRSLNRVLLPAYVTLRHSPSELRRVYRRTLRIISASAGTLLFGALLHAPALLEMLYDGKWRDSYGPLRVLCVYGLIRSVGATTGAIFLVFGRADLVRKPTQWILPPMLLALPLAYSSWGIAGVALAVTVPLAAGTGYAFVRAARFTRLSLRDLAADIVPAWSMALLVNAVSVPVRLAIDGWPGLILAGLITLSSAFLWWRVLMTADLSFVVEHLRRPGPSSASALDGAVEPPPRV